MAFESLSEKLQNTFKKLKGKGVLTEADINDAMREVKLALLEADVNFKIVKEFVAEVKEKCLGQEVLQSLTPGQQVIKIVNEQLTDLMGGTGSKLTYSPSGFTVLLMVGLQGTGKTTTCGKLATYLKKNGKKPMLCACDIYRPAAIDQLEVVAAGADVPVYVDRNNRKAEEIAIAARKEAERKGRDVLIVDTAGRLQIDEELMEELARVKKAVKPHEILLVVDALTGQDAVNAAEGFNEKLGIDGIIMTKMDGDSRGGAALSAKKVTGKPVKFVGMGEKLDALEPFHPDRMAGRILGMGDMLSLIEKAQESYDDQQAAKLLRRALIDIDAAALRLGIGIPGQDFHPALHRPLQRRTQAVRRDSGNDNRVVALVDEVVDKLHLAGYAGLGWAVIGDIHAQRFPRLFRAVAAAGKEADADQLRNKGDAVRRLRGNHAHRQRQHDQF